MERKPPSHFRLLCRFFFDLTQSKGPRIRWRTDGKDDNTLLESYCSGRSLASLITSHTAQDWVWVVALFDLVYNDNLKGRQQRSKLDFCSEWFLHCLVELTVLLLHNITEQSQQRVPPDGSAWTVSVATRVRVHLWLEPCTPSSDTWPFLSFHVSTQTPSRHSSALQRHTVSFFL